MKQNNIKQVRKFKISALVLLVGLISWSTSAQFLESFDTEIPSSWTVIDNDNQGGTWQYYSGNPFRGTGGVRINFEQETHDDYLISPQFTVISGVSDQVSFYAGGTGIANPESFDVKLSTTGRDPSDFTVLLGSETTITDVLNLGEYVNYTYNLSAFDGQAVHVAIVATSTASFRLHIDEFSVETLPSCPKPSSIYHEDLRATSLELNWTAGGTEDQWIVQYGTMGFDPETEGESISVTGSPHTTITDIESGTIHEVYVKADCGNGESDFAGPLRFVTPCLPAAIPFIEGFENGYSEGNALDGCWSQEILSNTYWMLNSTITYNNRAPRTGEWDIYLNKGSDTWIFHPINVEGGISYTLTFYARQASNAGGDVSASYGLSNSSSDMINEIIPTTEVINGDYQEFTGSFIPASSGVIYIGIKGYLRGSYFPNFMTMDDISVYESQFCLNPTDLRIDSTDPTFANISWTPGGTETEWLVKYGEPGFDPNTEGESVLVSDDPNVLITDLTPARYYSVFVKALCGGTDGNSHFAGAATLKTPPTNDDLCNAIPLTVDAECTGSIYTNVGATMETNEPEGSCFDAAGTQTVWFSFEAPSSGNVTVTTDFEGGTLEDTEVAVYESPTDCNDLSTLGAEIGCDEDGGVVGDGFLSVVTLTDLTAGSIYFVQVNGFMSFNEGTYEGSFCIEVQDDGVICPSPNDITLENLTETSVDVSWTPEGEETEWEIKYGEPGFDPLTAGTSVIDNDGIPGETLSQLDPDTNYEVYVRAICGTEIQSVFTGPESFTTIELSVGGYNLNNITFYPNPVKDNLILEADNPIENVLIYNLLGQNVMEIQGNESQLKLNTSDLNNGVYFIRVTINGIKSTFKLLKE